MSDIFDQIAEKAAGSERLCVAGADQIAYAKAFREHFAPLLAAAVTEIMPSMASLDIIERLKGNDDPCGRPCVIPATCATCGATRAHRCSRLLIKERWIPVTVRAVDGQEER